LRRVEYDALGQFLLGTDAHGRLVDRARAVDAAIGRSLGREEIECEQQRHQGTANNHKISSQRHHFRHHSNRKPRGSTRPAGRYAS
jgi:hypothetical protein